MQIGLKKNGHSQLGEQFFCFAKLRMFMLIGLFVIGNLLPAVGAVAAGTTVMTVEICSQAGTYLLEIEQTDGQSDSSPSRSGHCPLCYVPQSNLSAMLPNGLAVQLPFEATLTTNWQIPADLCLQDVAHRPRSRAPPINYCHPFSRTCASRFASREVPMVAVRPWRISWL